MAERLKKRPTVGCDLRDTEESVAKVATVAIDSATEYEADRVLFRKPATLPMRYPSSNSS